jgi:probable O-glycosylation ligase (exosortase A-associated)
MKGLVLTYLLVYGGAALALINPFVGVCVYWILDIVRPQFMFGWAGAQGSFSLIVALATIAGWVFRNFGTWRFGRGRIIVGLLLCYYAWTALSALDAANQSVALAFMVENTKRVLMFVIAVSLADSPARTKKLAWVIAGSAGYLALEMNLRYLAGFNEIQQLGYGGMDNNSMAISLITCFGPALFLALYPSAPWQRAVAAGSAALIVHAVLLTFSRGGMLGIIVAGIGALLVIPKRPRYLLPMALAVAIALRFAGPELRDRFSTSFSEEQELDYSAHSRLDLWMDCVKVMQRYPLLGVGPDHFPLIAEEFGWPRGKEAHSLWLQVGAEVGVPGMALLGLFFGLAITRMWRLARSQRNEDGDPWTRYSAYMVVTSLMGFAFSAQFVSMKGLETPLFITVIAVGALRSTRTARAQDANAVRGAQRRPRNFAPVAPRPVLGAR